LAKVWKIRNDRFCSLYDPLNALRSTEIAFIVEEDWHGQGMASGILRHLMHIAREEGVSQFEAEVLSENRAMLAVFPAVDSP
jgi:RimJ/RimL family protein N-acetyltransferase